jgi:hypothetical protein
MTNVARIAQLKAEIEKLESADKAFSEKPLNHQVAIRLHKLLCHHNHTDGCGWEYEGTTNGGEDWKGYAHARYLTKANKLLDFCCFNTIEPEVAINLIIEMNNL